MPLTPIPRIPRLLWAQVKNPSHKGKWAAELVDNPNYKGPWKARQIDNPGYFYDAQPHVVAPIGGESSAAPPR